MARDGYQSVSAIQSLIFGRAAQHYLTSPGLAFSFFSAAQPEFWAPMFTHVDLPLQTESGLRWTVGSTASSSTTGASRHR